MRRAFRMTSCSVPQCGGGLKLLAALMSPPPIRFILVILVWQQPRRRTCVPHDRRYSSPDSNKPDANMPRRGSVAMAALVVIHTLAFVYLSSKGPVAPGEPPCEIAPPKTMHLASAQKVVGQLVN